ncbi:hypothetical protein C0991_010607 [Blastosporella zonata]|nr:hypothetical protein C0991_010607 [Blastosporella zonata]
MALNPGPQDAYERARRTYTEVLTAKERSQIEMPTTLSDLLSKARALSETIRQQPRYLHRLGDAATKVKPFEKLLEAVCKLPPGKGGDLIWASISFILNLAKDNADMFDEVLNFFLTMSDEMEYVKVLEDTFKGAPLVAAVVEVLYVSILDFWVKAVKYYRPKPSKALAARFFSSIKSFTSSSYMLQKFQLLKAEIAAQKARLHDVASAQHYSDSANHHKKTEATCQAVLVAWIDAPSYEADLHSATKHHHAGTCEWVLRKKEYIKWRDQRDNPLILIYGIPGAGKTILSSWLITQISNQASTSGQLLLYHFFKASDDSKRTPLAAMRSLVDQLYEHFRRSNHHTLISELEAQLDALSGKAQVNFMQLWFILSSNLQKLYLSNPSHQSGCYPAVTIILDAMDECKGPKPLVRELHKLVFGASGAIRVLVTSRKSGEHVNEFARVPTDELIVLEISRDDVKHDIASFTRFKIEKMERLRGDQHVSLRNTVIAELGKVENHQGMFLWSYLVCKEVKLQLQVSAIWRLLKNLPKGLDAMYARICNRLAENEQHCDFGRSVLQWIVASSRPLRFGELEQALKTMQDQSANFFDDDVYDEEYGLGLLWSRKDIVEACGDLVTYTGLTDGDMIGLVHLSARHFLTSKPSQIVLPPDPAPSSTNLSSFLVDIPKAEYAIGTTCLDYLLSESLHFDEYFTRLNRTDGAKKERDSLSRRHPLFNYAVLYWPEYVFNSFSVAPKAVDIDPLAAKVSLFLAHSFSVIWMQEYIQHLGAETAAYIVRRFSDLPSDTTSREILAWGSHVGQILGDFSRTLSRNPQMIRMCLPFPGGVPNIYQPHSQVFVRPANHSAGIDNTSPTPLTPPLEKSNGRWVHYDPITDSVFSVDLLSETICLRRHVLTTGMPLRPAVLETHEPDLFSFRSAAVSARSGFIAVTFGSSGLHYERARERYTTVCWSLITSGTLSRTSEWAEFAFVECLDGPSADKYANTSQEVEMVAFGMDNTLVAPGGIWDILTEERAGGTVGTYGPDGEQTLRNLCFSGNGERAARISSSSKADREVIEVLDIKGSLICGVGFPRSAGIQLLSFSPTGQKLVFQECPPATGKSPLEFKCLVANSTGFMISIPHPLDQKSMQHPRFTRDEGKVISIIPGLEFLDGNTGERSSHDYGCSVAVWTFDKDAQGHYLSYASMAYLFKSRDHIGEFAFCLTRSPKGPRSQHWDDGLIAVGKSGTVVQRRLSETWTEEEEQLLYSSHSQLSSTFGSVMAEKVLWRRNKSPDLLIFLEDMRYVTLVVLTTVAHTSWHSDEDFTLQKWALGSPNPTLMSSVRNIFHQAFRHNENCFFSSTGSHFIDVPANEFYQVQISSDRLYLESLPLPFVIDGCAFSPDDRRMAFIHFEGSEIMVSVFDVSDGRIATRRASKSLNDMLGLNLRSNLDLSEIRHSKSSSRFNKITFSSLDANIFAVSICYFKFKLALGTLVIKQVNNELIASKVNDHFMFSLRFSMCGEYLYNADILFSEVPTLSRLPKDATSSGTFEFKHPPILKFGTFYVCTPYIFKLREDGQTGAVYLDHRLIDQDGEQYYSREVCVRPDALPDRLSETTLIWPHETDESFDEVQLVIASQRIIVIKTGIRSRDMMKKEFWF